MQKKITFSLLFLLIFLFSGCLSFGIPGGQTTQERAVAAGDPSICNTASQPDVCKMAVERSLANNQNEEIDCSEMTGNQKDSCLSEKALKEQKATVCGDITDSIARNSCYSKVANAKGEWEVCQKMDNSTRQNQCMASIAKQKKDASICEHASIYNTDYGTTECIRDTLKGNCNVAMCEGIQNTYNKDYCKNIVSSGCW